MSSKRRPSCAGSFAHAVRTNRSAPPKWRGRIVEPYESERDANRKFGRKYADGRPTPLDPDPEKAAAAIFYEAWQRLERDRVYRAWRERLRTRRSPATRA